MQRNLLREILEKIPVHPAAHGFVPGRSTVTNAAVHAGAELVLKFDLSDFFPTIHFVRVAGLFGSFGYRLDGNCRFSSSDKSNRVASTLARLCTFNDDPHQYGGGYVPQGDPTSPAISNLICRRLDARLEGLAKGLEGAYTRYADDLTFSFKASDLNIGRFRWWVDQICHQEGFLVNQKKFRVIRQSQRQVVTGIVVNDSLRVPRRQRRRFRATEWLWEKAARGSDGRELPWGSPNLVGGLDYRARSSKLAQVQKKSTCAVGEHSAVRNPYGCEDMVGNVSEWCMPGEVDVGAIPESWPVDNPEADGAPQCASVRGSAYMRKTWTRMESHNQRQLQANHRTNWVGFRPALLPMPHPMDG